MCTGYRGSRFEPESGDPALDLQLDLAQASLEGLTLLFPEAKELAVAGPVAGYAQVWGRISDPSGEAQVMVRDGRMLDQPLAATVDLALQDGILTLKESQVHWGEATLTGQGQIANWQELALKFQARRIPLEQLPGSLSVPAHLSGQIDGDLMITGTRTRPKVRGLSPWPRHSTRGIGLPKASVSSSSMGLGCI